MGFVSSRHDRIFFARALSRVGPGETATTSSRDPPASKYQEEAGFLFEIGAGCARRNLVVSSVLAWGGSA